MFEKHYNLICLQPFQPGFSFKEGYLKRLNTNGGLCRELLLQLELNERLLDVVELNQKISAARFHV